MTMKNRSDPQYLSTGQKYGQSKNERIDDEFYGNN